MPFMTPRLQLVMGFLMRASKKKVPQVKRQALTAAPHTGGSPELGAPTLTTVGQIVEQLGPVAPDAGAMSERIRHWTREGLLLPVNQHHAGTGGIGATVLTPPTKRQFLMRSLPPASN